jgi:hypothetical protein
VAGFLKTEHPEDTLTFPHTQLSIISRVLLAIMQSAERRQPVEIEPVDLDTL